LAFLFAQSWGFCNRSRCVDWTLDDTSRQNRRGVHAVPDRKQFEVREFLQSLQLLGRELNVHVDHDTWLYVWVATAKLRDRIGHVRRIGRKHNLYSVLYQKN
jgi:hypothetical protein